MGDENVCTGFGHGGRFVGVEAIGRCQQVHFSGQPDEIDFQPVAHVRFFKVLPEVAIDQADGGEILNPRKPGGLHFAQKDRHESERIRSAHSGEHGRVLHHRQHLAGHVHHDGVRITVGHHPGERAATAHAEPAGIVDHDQIDPTGFFELRGQSCPRTAADDRSPRRDFRPQPFQNRRPRHVVLVGCVATHQSVRSDQGASRRTLRVCTSLATLLPDRRPTVQSRPAAGIRVAQMASSHLGRRSREEVLLQRVQV